MEITRVVIIAIGVTGLGLVILSNLIFYYILGQVNARLPAADQVSSWGANTKYFSVLRRHATMYPSSNMRKHMALALLFHA